MRNAIQWFFTYNLQSSEDHSKGLDWYILDREGINQDILQILFRESGAFGRALVGHEGKCTRQPEGGLFDLVVRSSSGETTFLEVKIDKEWGFKQREKQIRRLHGQHNTKGVLVLLSQAACKNTKHKIKELGAGLFSKASYAELFKALDAAQGAAKIPEIAEFAAAYKLALHEQEERARRVFRQFGQPDS